MRQSTPTAVLDKAVRQPTHTWFTQYECSTRRLPHRLPTRSSATDCSLRWNFSCVIPCVLGLPYTIPLELGLLRLPRRTATRKMTKPAKYGISATQCAVPSSSLPAPTVPKHGAHGRQYYVPTARLRAALAPGGHHHCTVHQRCWQSVPTHTLQHTIDQSHRNRRPAATSTGEYECSCCTQLGADTPSDNDCTAAPGRTLLGLVAQTACLVGTRRTHDTVNLRALAAIR